MIGLIITWVVAFNEILSDILAFIVKQSMGVSVPCERPYLEPKHIYTVKVNLLCLSHVFAYVYVLAH